MATDLGKPSAGPQERLPRPRGAHAAVKGRPRPPATPTALVTPTSPATPTVPTAPTAPITPTAPTAPASPAPHRSAPRRSAPRRASPARHPAAPRPALLRPLLLRPTATGLCAAALVAAVVPLAILQIPDAIAWSLPSQFTATGPNALASLLRAASLALPAMAIAAPFGALATRRFRAGPVLLAGLLVIGVADALGEGTRTVPLIGADRLLHGLGAGISMVAVAAIVAERRPARFLAGWWACAVVCALAAAPALMRHRVTAGGWRAALQPCPWLAGLALALAALYAVLAEGTARTAVRSVSPGGRPPQTPPRRAFPAAERALLALLAAPVAGICAVTVAVTYRGDHAVVAAAIADTIALAGLAVIAVRASTAGRLAAVCVVIGFTLAPAAGTVSALTPPGQPGWQAGGAALAGAVCAAALALTRPARSARIVTAAGLFVAAAAFAAAALAGSAVARPGVLALLCVPLAGGLAAALAAAVRGAGTGGAVCGVVVMLAGVVGGYLVAGAVQYQALQAARTAAAVHVALVTTTTRWALLAAVVTAALALVMAAAPGRRGLTPTTDSGAPPVRRPAVRPIVGKLDGSGESSASGGGLAHHREDHLPGTQ